ncbi:unnamed protein product [Haemonchus placei]|uniref:Transposase n=1 Tax=Haemonchus placei TaxID=6290 RepID=A0A0N4WAG9_HAEPC|nr:unnamed protein product [Haemonchus placei]
MAKTCGGQTMSADVCNAVLRGIEQVMKQAKLARLFTLLDQLGSTGCTLLKKIIAIGMIAAAPLPGRSWMTSRAAYRNILRLSRGKHRLTSTDIQRDYPLAVNRSRQQELFGDCRTF